MEPKALSKFIRKSTTSGGVAGASSAGSGELASSSADATGAAAARETATADSMDALQRQQSMLDKQIARWTKLLPSGPNSPARAKALWKRIDDASAAVDKIDDKLLQLI